ncbi:MAG TPA: hypothetical protein PLW27_07495 [Kiritimatiellia bacterium]|jgi:hypothetical protein|nr:MAG: hypothetical protein BWX70_01039 [Verrucomicrobia bacterium ADurb.Bin070]HPB11632.1 hypothetical protein [Kiritimatiellia bacterium]HPO36640.1 hypothetical protein [Kiritimatiellia bacterium]HQA38733.1 hypothetical protein [Kiritimatiellia bacterium]HQL49714.1 hypothetical protein [Kiritimatiellia bacterium]
MSKPRNNLDGGRFRARAARRPLRFWWQAFALLGMTALLWSNLPVNAVLFEPRVLAPFPEPRAAYVVLAPEQAAQALANMRASWGAPGVAADMELGVFDVVDALKPPVFLEQGARFPGVWQPAAVEPLALALPEIDVAAFPGDPFERPLPAARTGVVARVNGALRDAGFSFVSPSGPLSARSGECRFFVETDDAGAVSHVLLLTPASESTAVLERAVQRGTARGAANGHVIFTWRFAP